jgi:DNA repair exonuclease SbcCD ATPase subunit
MSEPLDTDATCADCRAHDGWAAWCDECHCLAREEIDRLREENADLRDRLAEVEAEMNAYANAYAEANKRLAAETEAHLNERDNHVQTLKRVAAVRDWMGENNDDAEYDLAIVALNNILEGGDRG